MQRQNGREKEINQKSSTNMSHIKKISNLELKKNLFHIFFQLKAFNETKMI